MVLQTNTAELRRELPGIIQSQIRALKRIVGKSYLAATGLTENDPPELWLFALAKSDARSTAVSESGMKTQNEIGERIRRHIPDYDADKTYRANRQAMAQLGPPSFRTTVLRLAERIKDEAELHRCLQKLNQLRALPPIPQSAFQPNKKDSDQDWIVRNWVKDPLPENWALSCFCFFSDRAIAQMLHLLKSKKPLPASRLDRESERIRKICKGLGLVSAKHRLIKEVRVQAGKAHWIPFKRAIHSK